MMLRSLQRENLLPSVQVYGAQPTELAATYSEVCPQEFQDCHGTSIMSAESMPLALPGTPPRVRGEMSNSTAAGVDPSEAELIQRVLRRQDEAFRELCVRTNVQCSWLLKLF